MKKAFYKKWWFWVIVVLVIGAIGSLGGTEEAEDNSTQAEQSVVETVSPAPDVEVTEPVKEEPVQEEKIEEPVVEPAKTTYSVGDTAVAKSYKLTIESLNEIDSDNQFAQPDDGYEFVEIALLLENISDKELHISSLLHFDAYVDGFSIEEDLSAQVASDKDSMDGTVAAGKKLKGVLCYQVPENWSELEIAVDLGYSSKDEITLIFNNK